MKTHSLFTLAALGADAGGALGTGSGTPAPRVKHRLVLIFETEKDPMEIARAVVELTDSREVDGTMVKDAYLQSEGHATRKVDIVVVPAHSEPEHVGPLGSPCGDEEEQVEEAGNTAGAEPVEEPVAEAPKRSHRRRGGDGQA